MIFLLLAACSLSDLQERRLAHRFESADLVEHDATVGPTTVHYWKGGDGPPLLLLHGFGGDGLLTWHGQLPLAEEHTLVVPDLVWFGGSTSTSDDFSVQVQVDMVLGLMDAEGIDKADVAGISYGGTVAFVLATQHPERVDKLVMVDQPGPVWTAEDHAAMLARLGVAQTADIDLPTGPDGVRRLIELGYRHPPPTPEFVLDDVYEHLFTAGVEQKRKLLTAMDAARFKYGATPWSLTMPALVVWGDHDEYFPPEAGRRLAAAIAPGTPFVALPDTAHAPNIEDASAFNAAVSAFLAGREVLAHD